MVAAITWQDGKDYLVAKSWQDLVKELLSEEEYRHLHVRIGSSQPVWEIVYNIYCSGYEDGFNAAWREEMGTANE